MRPIWALVVPSIERVPNATEKDFEPCIEIHRRRVARHADIAEVAVHVSRRDVHAATQRSGKVCEVPADADPFLVGLQCRARATRLQVVEFVAYRA